jgi:hypothetical protein
MSTCYLLGLVVVVRFFGGGGGGFFGGGVVTFRFSVFGGVIVFGVVGVFGFTTQFVPLRWYPVSQIHSPRSILPCAQVPVVPPLGCGFSQDLPFEDVPEGHAQAQVSGFCTSPLIGHARHSHFSPIKTRGGTQKPGGYPVGGCDIGGGDDGGADGTNIAGVPHSPFACSGVVVGQQSGAVALLPVPHVGPVARQPVRAWFGVDPNGQLPLDKGGQNGVVPGRSQVGGPGVGGGGGWISERTQVLVSGL